MSKDWQKDVKQFHEKFGAYIGSKPITPSYSIQKLRVKLIEEEFTEVKEALEYGSLASIAKELCDLIYVTLGTAVSYGIDLKPIWEEVQKSNMAKVVGNLREDNKVLKPEGWVSPEEDIAKIIKNQYEKSK